MLGMVRFLVPVADTSTTNTVYGAGHQLNVTTPTLSALADVWRNEGKIAYLAPEPRQIIVVPSTTTAVLTFFLDQPCASAGGKADTTKAAVDGGGGALNVVATPASGVGTFTVNFTGLTTATTYYYLAYSVINPGSMVTNSPTYSFRTL